MQVNFTTLNPAYFGKTSLLRNPLGAAAKFSPQSCSLVFTAAAAKLIYNLEFLA
ncbi:MAG: hypothetical protein SPF98_05715 [Campylobacter sp.]|nr:hypothetical protein [Campylobacter sp.]